jgi:hypothetical protein
MTAIGAEIKRMKTHSLSADFKFKRNLGLKMFFNYLYDLGQSTSNYYHAINEVDYENQIYLRYTGIARTFGLAGYWDLRNSPTKINSISLNASVFESEYLKFGEWHDSKFNHQYAGNLIASRKIREPNTSKWFGNINLSYHIRGGLFNNNINLQNSQNNNQTLLSYTDGYVQRMQAYQRIDFRISFHKKIMKGPISQQSISLDIQNLLNKENDGQVFYDPFTQSLEIQNQLGMIPVLSYKLVFK